jgi:phosphoribosylformimino-5-aminoimidazole carboxamide ribotide isomerase
VIAIPAIDLRGGQAVQLVGGVPGTERVRLDDPAGVAEYWLECGYRALHIIDLDAALGTGENRAVIVRILRETTVPVQVGGGLRDEEAVAAMLDAGASRVIVGTRAILDPVWLAKLARRHPGRIVLAADVRDGAVLTRGWTASTAASAASPLAGTARLPLAATLVTDVGREGRLTGIDVALYRDLMAACRLPLQAAGGIRDLEDLRALSLAGAAAAILGMSLYTGAIDARAAATEFSA